MAEEIALRTRTSAKARKSPETISIDPIPALYREFCRVSGKVGNHLGADNIESRANDALYSSLTTMILSTPARSLEGAARQLQMLGTMIDSGGADIENIAIDSRMLSQLWLAIYGALNYMLPMAPQLPDDPEYSLANVETCPGQALGLFRKMQEAVR